MSGRDPQRAGRRFSRALAFTGVLVLSSLGSARADDRPAGQAPRFERDVLPILAENCLKCHGPETRKAGLDLRSPALMARGGSNGPVLVQGSAEESVLFEQVSSHAMPPGKAVKLSDAQVETIRAWIDGGAVAERGRSPRPPVTDVERRSWAFLPLARVPRPTVRNEAGRVRTPVDAFVLEKLEARGLGFSPEADRVTLARRACFDLLGLPPTPEQVDAFLADERPGRLRAAGRPAPGLAALRRALGTALARRRGLLGDHRRRQRRHDLRGPRGVLALPRLRRPLVQRRQAVRPLRQRAVGRRRAGRLAQRPPLHAGDPRCADGDRVLEDRGRLHHRAPS